MYDETLIRIKAYTRSQKFQIYINRYVVQVRICDFNTPVNNQ